MTKQKWSQFGGVVIICLVLVLLMGCVPKADYEKLQTDFISLQTGYDKLKADYEKLQANYNSLQQEKSDLEAELELYKKTFSATVHSGIQPPYLKATNSRITLERNPDATYPTWQQLMDFLENDDTDNNAYIPGIFECGDFAELLFNNAESSGIRATFVVVYFLDAFSSHALNAFKTTDKGLVYIDCTAPAWHFYSHGYEIYFIQHSDKIAHIQAGKPLSFTNLGWDSYTPIFWEDMGRVRRIEIYW